MGEEDLQIRLRIIQKQEKVAENVCLHSNMISFFVAIFIRALVAEL